MSVKVEDSDNDNDNKESSSQNQDLVIKTQQIIRDVTTNFNNNVADLRDAIIAFMTNAEKFDILQLLNLKSGKGVSEQSNNTNVAIDDDKAEFKVTQIYNAYLEASSKPIGAGQTADVFIEDEVGQIIGFEAEVDSINTALDVFLINEFGDRFILNNYTVREMIRRGRGMTVGDVEALPPARSKDTAGIPNDVWPYIQRAKLDNLEDAFDDSDPTIVIAYFPRSPITYSGLEIKIRNTSLDATVRLKSLILHRKIFTDKSPIDYGYGKSYTKDIGEQAPTSITVTKDVKDITGESNIILPNPEEEIQEVVVTNDQESVINLNDNDTDSEPPIETNNEDETDNTTNLIVNPYYANLIKKENDKKNKKRVVNINYTNEE